MKYRDLVENYFDVSNDSPDNEIKFNIIKQISPLIKESKFYKSLDFNQRNDLNKYMGKSISLFEGRVGFDKRDSIINGIEIPKKFLIEKMVYDRSNKGIKINRGIAEVIKKQVRGMHPFKLSRMYENNNGYRLVFEDGTNIYEISVKGG